MSDDVLVRLTKAQRDALFALAYAEVMTGEGTRVLAGALDALTSAAPALTAAQLSALSDARADSASLAEDYTGSYLTAWQSRDRAGERAMRALNALHRRRP